MLLLIHFLKFLRAVPQSSKSLTAVRSTLLQCFSVMGVPTTTKTGNAPAYIITEFTAFCSDRQIHHTTGIPYNPQGQGIVERAHHTLKLQLLKSKKGGTPKAVLALSLFTLNFLNLPQGDVQTAAEKHFSQSQQSLEASIPIKVQIF